MLNLILKTNWVFYIAWILFILLSIFIISDQRIVPWLIGNLKATKQTKTKQTLVLRHRQCGESRGLVR